MPDSKGFSLDSYVTVAERIAAFVAKHPDGSLQSEIVSMTETLVVVKAYAYRTPDDSRPGIGYSSLEIPGKTPYTRGSELENAESSAWGRAIAALGFEVKRGIATHDEIDSKREPEQRMKAPTSTEIAAERERLARRSGAPVPAAVEEQIVIAARELGGEAKAVTMAFLGDKGYGIWGDFLLYGAADAGELLARLTLRPERVR